MEESGKFGGLRGCVDAAVAESRRKNQQPPPSRRRRRLLVINDSVERRVAECVEYAMQNRISHDGILAIIAGTDRPPGDDDRRVVMVPRGYQCVFSIECHKNDHWYRHLSVSVDGEGVMPNPIALDVLLPLFGFQWKFNDDQVLTYLEEEVGAVNLLETFVE